MAGKDRSQAFIVSPAVGRMGTIWSLNLQKRAHSHPKFREKDASYRGKQEQTAMAAKLERRRATCRVISTSADQVGRVSSDYYSAVHTLALWISNLDVR